MAERKPGSYFMNHRFRGLYDDLEIEIPTRIEPIRSDLEEDEPPEFGITKTCVVKVHQFKNVDSPVVRLLYRGTRVCILFQEDDWYKVRTIYTPTYTGYIEADQLDSSDQEVLNDD